MDNWNENIIKTTMAVQRKDFKPKSTSKKYETSDCKDDEDAGDYYYDEMPQSSKPTSPSEYKIIIKHTSFTHEFTVELNKALVDGFILNGRVNIQSINGNDQLVAILRK
jgi:hypothetical protein